MLLERERARQAATDALDRARGGHGGAVFLVGEPGLGKTSLLAEAERRATGFCIAAAGSTEVEAWLPFGLLDRLLGPLGIPGGATDRGAEGSQEARVRRYLGLLQWLRSEAPRPLLLIIDDLHWSDPDSIELLSLLCRRLDDLAVAVVAGLRPWPTMAFEQAGLLAHDGLAVLEHLQPLTGAGASALLVDRLGGPVPEDLLARAVAACGGNPMLLAEVAEAWRSGEDVVSASPATLAQRLFLPRFAGVAPAALRWARAASVLGTRLRPDLASALSDQGPGQAAAALDALCSAGLLQGAPGGQVEFVHPLFCHALYEDLASPVRQALHARAFEILYAGGAEAAQLAPHALAGQLTRDPRAVEALASAGRAALAAGALSTASEHLQGAVQLAGPSASTGLRLELAGTLLAGGRLAPAEEVLRALLADAGLASHERVAGLRLLGQVLAMSARQEESVACRARAAELVEADAPDLAAEILLDTTFTRWLFEGPRSARADTARALALTEGASPARSGLRRAALAADGMAAALMGDYRSLDSVAEAARAVLAGAGADSRGAVWTWDVVMGYANVAKTAERFEDALSIYAGVVASDELQGAEIARAAYAVNHADTLARLGRLEEARDQLTQVLEVVELAPSLGPFASVGLASLHQDLGAAQESAAWASRVGELMEVLGEPVYLRLWLCQLACRERLDAGSFEEAVALAERAAALAESSGLLEPCVVPWHSAAIEAQVGAGRLDRAEELVARLEELCAPLPCRAPRAVAAAGRALIAWRCGRPADAEDLYREALAHNAAVPMPLAEAETLVAYGRFLRREGRPSAAREVLHRALERLEPTGAGRLQAAATEELAVAGGRRQRRAPMPAGALTAQEGRVAALAAKGLTNRQIAQQLFVSVKTVDHHLGRVYTKLGISSRRELMLSARDGFA